MFQKVEGKQFSQSVIETSKTTISEAENDTTQDDKSEQPSDTSKPSSEILEK